MAKKLGPSPVTRAVESVLGSRAKRVDPPKRPVKDASGRDSYDRMWNSQTTDSNNR